MKPITLEMVRDKWEACYEPDRLADLFDTPKTAIEVLTLKNGPWASVPPQDRLWVVLRKELVSAKTLRLFACWCAEQAIALIEEPDPRSVSAIEVARRYANGEATEKELSAAWSAARPAARDAAWSAASDAARAAASDAARAAARDAAWSAARAAASDAARSAAWSAAWSAARPAAWSAASDAARAAQIETLVQMIKQEAGVAA